MCSSGSNPDKTLLSSPREIAGDSIDPVHLEEVDDVSITTLVDNVYDGLLMEDAQVGRAPFSAGLAMAPQFEAGRTMVGLRAEHGFSALVSVRRGKTTSSLLFDTGISPDGMVSNAERLGVDLSQVQGVILSHGHFDHLGGLASLGKVKGTHGLPITVHPQIWTRRRLAIPGLESTELPTLSKSALQGEGFEVIERRQPSLLVDRCVLITGEIDRTTEFERGMPQSHQSWSGTNWQHDPLVLDDQALVIHVRGKGLVVLTGCGHGGAVNIVRHAMRLTGINRLHALLGGLHLGGPAFETIISPTTKAFAEMAPDLLAPGHCTGWAAQHALAAALPSAWVQGSSGTTYKLSAD